MEAYTSPFKYVSSELKLVKFNYKNTPFNLFAKLYEKFDYAYILESVNGPEKLAEYSFLGFEPQLIISAKDKRAEVYDKSRNRIIKEIVNDPLLIVKEIVKGNNIAQNNLRFIGGAVGYISYDVIRYWERIPKMAIDDFKLPDLEMAIYNDGIIFNHKNHEAYYYYFNKNRFKEIEAIVKSDCDFKNFSYSNLKTNIEKEDFEDLIIKAKNYINSGDIFQVVLSKRYNFNFKGDLIPFYKALRIINPSPYMYFLKMGNCQIIGSSPEMLVRVENNIVETFPIAGTKPRVKNNVKKDEALTQELIQDPKERAEHVMLVDLARNDIGKVSEFGSVYVPEFMKVYKYSHVQHIVSHVVGKLRKDCCCYDALRAMFPAGTVSGAPKVRAMEIIEECEPIRRGPYAGAVGYFSYNGNADFAIAIRTLIAKGDKAYIQVGAGIVADSIPEKEWFETEYKASALIKAIQLASERDN
ncbi:MAG: anthranilate synthase component I [Nitrososphaerales archaeon]